MTPKEVRLAVRLGAEVRWPKTQPRRGWIVRYGNNPYPKPHEFGEWWFEYGNKAGVRASDVFDEKGEFAGAGTKLYGFVIPKAR